MIAILSLMSVSLGCNPIFVPSRVEIEQSELIKTTGSNANVVFDAGVVFTDRENYVCFPLEQLGLGNETKPLSFTSSCECLRLSVRSFRDVDNEEFRSLEIYFPQNDKVSDEPVSVSHLAVACTATSLEPQKVVPFEVRCVLVGH